MWKWFEDHDVPNWLVLVIYLIMMGGGFLLIFAGIRLESKNARIEELLTMNSELQCRQFEVQASVETLHSMIDSLFGPLMEVTATQYHAVPHQTDDTPHITADNTVIDIHDAASYRYVAMSRDLIKGDPQRGYNSDAPFEFGDMIMVYNSRHYNGLWEVRDSMNRRWDNRIDFLVDVGDPLRKETVHIRKFDPVKLGVQ